MPEEKKECQEALEKKDQGQEYESNQADHASDLENSSEAMPEGTHTKNSENQIPEEGIGNDNENLTAADAVSQSAQGEVSTETDNENKQNPMPETKPEETGKNGSKSKIGILIVLLAVVAGAAFLFQKGMFSGGKKVDMPVAYVKDDNLYVDDLKNAPYLVAESLSDGGSYSYYYTAWGVTIPEDGRTLYFSDNIGSDGRFDLYKRSLTPEGENIQIASNVLNYQTSNDGAVCAYLNITEDEKIGLYAYDGQQEIIISGNAVLSEDSFLLSEDGKYIIYEQAKEDGQTQLAVQMLAEGEETLLTDGLVQFSMAKATGKVYYVGQEGDSYTIYEYTFGQEPVLVGKNAVAMEILGNNRDVLYCTQSSIQIQGRDILEDDMAEADAAVPTPDFGQGTPEEYQAYDEKAARDEVRLALQNGAFESPMQDCYIWSDGKAELVDTEILNAKAAVSPEGYVLYSKIDTSALEKVKLSQVGSLDEAQYMYYVNLSEAPRKTYFAKAGGESINLNRDMVGADSFSVSANGKRIAYEDAMSDQSRFYTVALDSQGGLSQEEKLGENVEMFQFSGTGESLYWLEPAADASVDGTLMVYENGKTDVVSEEVSGFRVAEDGQAVYFINDINPQTDNGKLYRYENGVDTEIDQEVFCLQYKGNGKLVYMKNYDMNTQLGDLYYWDGKASRLIDEKVSAIFIF